MMAPDRSGDSTVESIVRAPVQIDGAQSGFSQRKEEHNYLVEGLFAAKVIIYR